MGLFIFLTVVQALVAAVLVVLVLMQRSEGGGLGIGGGGPGGVMSARGAADFLSRATKWSAIVFVLLAIVLAGLAVNAAGTRRIDQTLDRTVGAAGPGADPLAPGAPASDPLSIDPLSADPLAGAGGAAGTGNVGAAPAPSPVPAPSRAGGEAGAAAGAAGATDGSAPAGVDPLAGVAQ